MAPYHRSVIHSIMQAQARHAFKEGIILVCTIIRKILEHMMHSVNPVLMAVFTSGIQAPMAAFVANGLIKLPNSGLIFRSSRSGMARMVIQARVLLFIPPQIFNLQSSILHADTCLLFQQNTTHDCPAETGESTHEVIIAEIGFLAYFRIPDNGFGSKQITDDLIPVDEYSDHDQQALHDSNESTGRCEGLEFRILALRDKGGNDLLCKIHAAKQVYDHE